MGKIQSDSAPDMQSSLCSANLTCFEKGLRLSAEVQHFSEFGAVIRLLENADLPNRLSILIPKHRINVGCQVVWRHRDDVGLSFDQKIELPEDLSDQAAGPESRSLSRGANATRETVIAGGG